MNWYTTAILAAIFISYLVLRSIVGAGIRNYGRSRGVAYRRIRYVGSTLSMLMFFLMIAAMTLVIGVNYQDLGILVSSMFAILGVALFAQWSILSNVTASVMIFFFFPYRVGDYVRVLDGDNTVEGEIEEINLFHILLLDTNGQKVTFPNAMAFQKSIIITSPSQSEEEDETGQYE